MDKIILIFLILACLFCAIYSRVCLLYNGKMREVICRGDLDKSCEYVRTLTEYEYKNDIYYEYGIYAINITKCQQRDGGNIDYNKVKSIDRGNLSGQLNLDDYPETNVIKLLHYANNSIASLNKEQFKNVQQVRSLNLNFNIIKTIADDTFDALPNLILFFAEHNLLSKIPRIASLKNLTYLDLSYNEITHVDNAFHNLATPELINLAHNKIKTLEYCAFCNLNKLTMLDLSWNEIEILPDNFTTGMTSLNHLILEHNKLTKITDEIFDEIDNKLLGLSLSYNEIASIDPYSFHALNDLRHLYLNDNKLVFLPDHVFEGLRRLSILDLSNNSIVELQANSMRQLSSIMYVYINNNKLTFLYGEFIENLKFRALIHMHGNPWQCACLDDMLKRFKEREIFYDYYKEGKVVRPGRQLVCVQIYRSPDFCVKDITLTTNFDTIFYWALKRYGFTNEDFEIEKIKYELGHKYGYLLPYYVLTSTDS